GRAGAAGAFHPDAGRRAAGCGRLVEAVGECGVDGRGGAAGVADDPGELVGREPDVEGDDGGPELEGGDGQLGPADRVVAEDAEAIPGRDPQGPQARRDG